MKNEISCIIFLLYFLMIIEAGTQDNIYTDFLHNTLKNLHEKRVDNAMDLNLTELSSEIDGNIYLDSNYMPFTLSGNSYDHRHNPMDTQETVLSVDLLNPSSIGGDISNNEKIKGYYYYYYPLNNNLYKHKDTEPTKGEEMISEIMETIMNNNTMSQKQSNVTPLFKAMTWFIGTAMFFVVSVLLLPYKVKKAKKMEKFRTLEGYNHQVLDNYYTLLYKYGIITDFEYK